MQTFKARITGVSGPVKQKENGKLYQQFPGELIEGPAKGQAIVISFTQGEGKTAPSKGEEVNVVHRAVRSNTDPSKTMHFFEVGSNKQIDNDALTALLGNAEEVEEGVSMEEIPNA